MASIIKVITVAAPVDDVWEAVRDYGAVHERVAAGFVIATELDGRDRIVTFASGAVARERLVTLDDDRRRLVYSVVDSALGCTHHQASVVVDAAADGHGCRFTWTTDVLPDELAPALDGLMEAGARAIRATLTGATVS
jgi:hypothetical protein